ncbi:hypothetical protein [Streptomyces sp. NBC_01408]|uniref:hypothetical protein n=1 Tax=Streptomyces sp. NBC_01408 TaxID=2903855 RepID=UPI002258812D|nr:hypothetical protein [Streptomyces sp. NBC_01408]MCX4693191.1 hypothetical protein [Streptomyces sp. NBC_01408]
MPDTRRRLLVIERAYRGAVETQFADVLYLARELNRQQGGVDILLRGLAVTFAAAGPVPRAALRIGRRELDTLPAPREALRVLLAEDARVWAEESDLARFETGPDWVLPGVRRAGPAGRPDWTAYQGVHFL